MNDGKREKEREASDYTDEKVEFLPTWSYHPLSACASPLSGFISICVARVKKRQYKDDVNYCRRCRAPLITSSECA